MLLKLEKKEDPCYLVAGSIAVLCPRVMWKQNLKAMNLHIELSRFSSKVLKVSLVSSCCLY